MSEQGGHIIDALAKLLFPDTWNSFHAWREGRTEPEPGSQAAVSRYQQDWSAPEEGLHDKSEDLIPGQDWAKLAGKAGLKAGLGALAPLAGLVGKAPQVKNILPLLRDRPWWGDSIDAEAGFNKATSGFSPRDKYRSLIDALGLEGDSQKQATLARTLSTLSGETTANNNPWTKGLNMLPWSQRFQLDVPSGPNFYEPRLPLAVRYEGSPSDLLGRMGDKSEMAQANSVRGFFDPRRRLVAADATSSGFPKTAAHELSHWAVEEYPDTTEIENALGVLTRSNPKLADILREMSHFYSPLDDVRLGDEMLARINAGQVKGRRLVPPEITGPLDRVKESTFTNLNPEFLQAAEPPDPLRLWTAQQALVDPFIMDRWKR